MDSLFIYKEFKLLFIIVMISSFSMSISLISLTIIDIPQNIKHKSIFFDIQTMTLMPLCIVFTVVWYLQTVWVNNQNTKAIRIHKMNTKNNFLSANVKNNYNSKQVTRISVNFVETLQSSTS